MSDEDAGKAAPTDLGNDRISSTSQAHLPVASLSTRAGLTLLC